MEIVRYHESFRDEWNNFVTNAKNGYFFFHRNYMDYHSDRFVDFSLLFYEKCKLIAVLPANISDKQIITHGGLTFGGIITDDSMSTPKMLLLFDMLTSSLKDKGIKRLLYKVMPYIYYSIPSQEDLYALYRYNAKLVRRDVSSTINLKDKIKFSKGKKYGVSKAKKHGLSIRRSDDFAKFMEIQSEILEEKYQSKTTHSVEEISSLAKKFPHHIKLYCAYYSEEMVAGIIVFDDKQLLHTQYMASSKIGKELGALDLLVDHLINNECTNRKFFNFGISTESNGIILNEGLIRQKEMFGARATVYDFYEIEID